MFGIFISILKKFNNNFILFLYFYYNVNTKNYLIKYKNDIDENLTKNLLKLLW